MDSHVDSKHLTPHPVSHLKYGIIGSLAGTFMEAVVHPIDTIRTRIKSNIKKHVPFARQAKVMFHNEGLSSYLRGLTCTLLSASISRGSYFYIYEKSKYVLTSKNWVQESMAPFIAGFIGGFIGDLVEIPCDLVRTRMQLEPGYYDYRHVFDGFKKVYQREGITNLFRGGSVYLILDAVDTGLTFGFYELFRHAFNPIFPAEKQSTSLANSLASSALAASLTAILTNPFDVLVTRMQMGSLKKKRRHPKIPDILKGIYKHEGAHGFFKGLTGRIGQYGLSAVILFPTYEYLKMKFGLTDMPDY